ncbi:hypothetical protein FNF31_03141 [Cafeteria roenbergensis]|uniref:tRNA/rRNA methyltransferase SpoU type domain-containing protein n=1 Tax=Cafeteria roenbergensis TaxID=33653 RepID=A0A5A8DDC9_CAFRO|nr:hypothetical protein FNF31_03141 [Cafeteria roenbergensis]KAA0170737.1 hypothetical protein FNF28_01279 [Cafeteria roenbergensis]
MAGAVADLSRQELLRLVYALRLTVKPKRWYRLQRVAAQRRFDVRLVLENLANPRNVAAVYRVAEAYGLARLELLSSLEVTPFALAENEGWASDGPDAGASRWLDVRTWHDARDCLTALDDDGFRVLASDLNGEALPLEAALGRELGGAAASAAPIAPGRPMRHMPSERAAGAAPPSAPPPSTAVAPSSPGGASPPRGLALVLGNEHRGTSRRLVERAHASFFIPQFGMVQSLNVSVAAGIATHAATAAMDARAAPCADAAAGPMVCLGSRLAPGAPASIGDQIDVGAADAAAAAVAEFEEGYGAAALALPEAWPDVDELPTEEAQLLIDSRAVFVTDAQRLRLLATWLLRNLPRELPVRARQGVLADPAVAQVMERI